MRLFPHSREKEGQALASESELEIARTRLGIARRRLKIDVDNLLTAIAEKDHPPSEERDYAR